MPKPGNSRLGFFWVISALNSVLIGLSMMSATVVPTAAMMATIMMTTIMVVMMMVARRGHIVSCPVGAVMRIIVGVVVVGRIIVSTTQWK